MSLAVALWAGTVNALEVRRLDVSFQGLDAPSDAVGELGTLSLFTNVEREARAWRQASE